MSKECKKYNELIDLYIEGSLFGDELSGFEDHISSCPDCKKELDAALLIEQALTIESVVLPPGFSQSIAENLFEKTRVSVPSYSTFDLSWFAITFSFLLVFISFIIQELSISGSKLLSFFPRDPKCFFYK
jgi:hypothetical protein